MKPWYTIRDINQLIRMFRKAVTGNDPHGAAAIYGCLFDMLQSAKLHTEERRSYRWTRVVNCLNSELDIIQKQAVDYPAPIQQALITKVILYQESRRAS